MDDMDAEQLASAYLKLDEHGFVIDQRGQRVKF